MLLQDIALSPMTCSGNYSNYPGVAIVLPPELSWGYIGDYIIGIRLMLQVWGYVSLSDIALSGSWLMGS